MAWLEFRVIVDSPGFISREWIETLLQKGRIEKYLILPALLVGSGLKHLPLCRPQHPPHHILPALLVGSGLKHAGQPVAHRRWNILPALLVGSGLKPVGCPDLAGFVENSPGFISREWIETAFDAGAIVKITSILPALLVGSGLKPRTRRISARTCRILPALLVGSGLKQTRCPNHPSCIRFSRLY